MAPSALERFTAAALSRGVDVEPTVYPAGTRTAADAAAAVGCELAQIVKSLVFVADGRPVMALVSGADRADMAKLAVAFGAREVRKADAEVVRDATGYAIGGTPPFGHESDVPTVVDRRLLDLGTVWAAAGTPDSCFPIEPERLAVLCGEVADVAE